nr:MAG TPA: hypothetical protein [Caudoviricetes sp.]
MQIKILVYANKFARLHKKSPFGDLLIIYLLFSWFSLPFFSAQIYLQI